MPPELKICGLTRVADSAEAARVGARYLGVIFAGGPRALDPERAAGVLEGGGRAVRRVGVFANPAAPEIARVAAAVRLDVVQLHGDPTADDVEAMRRHFAGDVWAVCRIAGEDIPAEFVALAEVADAVVLDTKRDGVIGGTGTAFAWRPIARVLTRRRGKASIVLAGGLTPENVTEAIALFAPDVVDVSSGVEREPGVKDHARMRAMAEQVLQPARADART